MKQARIEAFEDAIVKQEEATKELKVELKKSETLLKNYTDIVNKLKASDNVVSSLKGMLESSESVLTIEEYDELLSDVVKLVIEKVDKLEERAEVEFEIIMEVK